jgi:Holin of 3TMs, for gene-transfer release
MALDPITAILNIGQTIIDRVIPDKTQAAAAKQALVLAEINGELQAAHDQLNVDAVEAASNSIFVAGWRPFVGWCCGAALAYSYIVQPIAVSTAVIFGKHFDASVLPHLNMTELLGLLTSMMGMGIMRSVDKAMGNSDPGAGAGNGH